MLVEGQEGELVEDEGLGHDIDVLLWGVVAGQFYLEGVGMSISVEDVLDCLEVFLHVDSLGINKYDQ